MWVDASALLLRPVHEARSNGERPACRCVAAFWLVPCRGHLQQGKRRFLQVRVS
jgi:hypothetical protein